ncbi:hypothetical protein HK101_006776 [Irineochytrium annulatum]|nr:hypothetical protein HK101_006776 [Irineochytrium annulatum]
MLASSQPTTQPAAPAQAEPSAKQKALDHALSKTHTPHDEAFEVTPEKLAFLARWCGLSADSGDDVQRLKDHVLSFWKENKGKQHTYKSIQKGSFLV